MKEGDRVQLRADAPLCGTHPELGGKIGVIGSIMRSGGATLMHVRYAGSLNLLVLNVTTSQFELADTMEPMRPALA
jgi:hypothetical protein